MACWFGKELNVARYWGLLVTAPLHFGLCSVAPHGLYFGTDCCRLMTSWVLIMVVILISSLQSCFLGASQVIQVDLARSHATVLSFLGPAHASITGIRLSCQHLLAVRLLGCPTLKNEFAVSLSCPPRPVCCGSASRTTHKKQ